MASVAPLLKSEEVSLEIKTLGVISFLSFLSVSDAADHAIALISSGKAIPKSVRLGDRVVMSEADINLYWESSQNVETR